MGWKCEKHSPGKKVVRLSNKLTFPYEAVLLPLYSLTCSTTKLEAEIRPSVDYIKPSFEI